MKDFLNYYYYLLPEKIKKINNNYYFNINNNYFGLYLYFGNINNLNSIFILNNYMSYQNNKINKIILNKEGNIYTIKDNKIYILVLLTINSKELININNILNFYNINPPINSLNHTNWYYLWCNKIDYLEKIRSNLKNNDNIIYNSLPYYIGLTENAISYLKYLNLKNNNISICHKRINYKDSISDLYNPLNLIIDFKVRDIAEYYKSLFFNTKDINYIINSIKKINMNDIDKIYFYIRMLYPSYYFDKLDEVLKGNLKQEELLNIINYSSEYEYLLYRIFLLIKSNNNLLEIEWINKKFA